MTGRQLEAYGKLVEIDRRVTMIGHINAVLGYDFETVISRKGREERSRQMSFLTSMAHDIATGKEVGDLLDVLCAVEEADDEEKAMIRVWRKRYGNEALLPSKLVSGLSTAASIC